MRKRLAWLAGALGVAALLEWIRRRRRPRPQAAEATGEADPAKELRSALADSRAAEQPQAAEPGPAAEKPPSLEERRRRVHEQAQAAIDVMREPPKGA